jgi:hypothetical protein
MESSAVGSAATAFRLRAVDFTAASSTDPTAEERMPLMPLWRTEEDGQRLLGSEKGCEWMEGGRSSGSFKIRCSPVVVQFSRCPTFASLRTAQRADRSE